MNLWEDLGLGLKLILISDGVFQGSCPFFRAIPYLTFSTYFLDRALNDGSSYAYDYRGLRVKQDRNGAIYTLYGPDEKLLFRFDRQTQVTSEYFYVDGKLVARRDADISRDTPSAPDGNESSGISVAGLTISWSDDGWYQVQSENGSTTVCSGGRSCTVPTRGTYLVINHTTQVRSTVTVN